MYQVALLALAAQKGSTRPDRPDRAPSATALPARAGRSGTRIAWRLGAALAASLVLIVALVDPLLVGGRPDPQLAAPEQGGRRE